MKKHVWLVYSFATLLLNFIVFWFSDVLLNRFFIFGVIPVIISVLMLLVGLVVSFVYIFQRKAVKEMVVSVTVLTLTVLLIVFFPFRTAKLKVEFPLYEEKRIQAVEMIADGEIDVDEMGNAKLPKQLSNVSSDGYITVYQNDSNQLICFWVFRGMLSGSVQLMYSSQGEDLIYENETSHPIEDIIKIKDHWYLVETDY